MVSVKADILDAIDNITQYTKVLHLVFPLLKVGTNEDGTGCGRWLTVGIYFSLW
jgi:hypothetical protein